MRRVLEVVVLVDVDGEAALAVADLTREGLHLDRGTFSGNGWYSVKARKGATVRLLTAKDAKGKP